MTHTATIDETRVTAGRTAVLPCLVCHKNVMLNSSGQPTRHISTPAADVARRAAAAAAVDQAAADRREQNLAAVRAEIPEYTDEQLDDAARLDLRGDAGSRYMAAVHAELARRAEIRLTRMTDVLHGSNRYEFTADDITAAHDASWYASRQTETEWLGELGLDADEQPLPTFAPVASHRYQPGVASDRCQHPVAVFEHCLRPAAEHPPLPTFAPTYATHPFRPTVGNSVSCSDPRCEGFAVTHPWHTGHEPIALDVVVAKVKHYRELIAATSDAELVELLTARVNELVVGHAR